jgi:hypothetical protein
VRAKENGLFLLELERVMSKRQALLETLLGAAELISNRKLVSDIRQDLLKMTPSSEADGYRRLAREASEPPRQRRKAA